MTLSGCEGLSERLAELSRPNKLRVTAMLTVLNQKMHQYPMIPCPLTDLLFSLFFGVFFVSLKRQAEVSGSNGEIRWKDHPLTFCSCGPKALSVSRKMFSVRQVKTLTESASRHSLLLLWSKHRMVYAVHSVWAILASGWFWVSYSEDKFPASSTLQAANSQDSKFPNTSVSDIIRLSQGLSRFIH